MHRFNFKIRLLFIFIVLEALIGSGYSKAEPISIKKNERYRRESESVKNLLLDKKHYRGGSFNEISFRINYENLNAHFYKIRKNKEEHWHVECENLPVDSEKKCLLSTTLRVGPSYLESERLEISISSRWRPSLKLTANAFSKPLSIPRIRFENDQAYYFKNKTVSKKTVIFKLDQRENQDFFSAISKSSPRDFYISDSRGHQHSLSTEILTEGFSYSKWIFENSQ